MDSLAPLLEKLEFPIDFEGQRAASRVTYLLAGGAGLVSLVASIVYRDLNISLYVFAGFFALTLLAILPPYSAYRENPVTFTKRPPPKKIVVEMQ